MQRAPETILLVILGLLLAATAALLFLPLDYELAVQGARWICVALTVLLFGGLIIPWRKHLARRRAAGDEAKDGERS